MSDWIGNLNENMQAFLFVIKSEIKWIVAGLFSWNGYRTRFSRRRN